MEGVISERDSLDITRVQKVRCLDGEDLERVKENLILDLEKLKTAKKEMVILHPLPRVNEITKEVDADPRAAYFRQVENGKFVRMALIIKLLEWAKDPSQKMELVPSDAIVNTMTCSNRRCISTIEDVESLFRLVDEENEIYRCVYCEAKAR